MSSLLEISERQLVDSTPNEASFGSSPGSSCGHSALDIPTGQLPARSEFFKVLDAAVEFKIPYISITQIGLPNSFENKGSKSNIHYGYLAGTGYSAQVVRHYTEYDVGQTKKGTIVALKQYLPKGSVFGQREGEADKIVFQAVRREIAALCHPGLGRHENVCRILYIGWHKKSIYPCLALELAAYGTLEDAMTAPGIGLSWLQKMNITIDIMSAIEAVHSSSMIHGDIKPGNIILQHHDSRQVVAKIIDLAGSRDLYDNPDVEFRPGMGTELWSSPEVCLGSQHIDWYKADAYSLGLLIASLWARPPVWAQKKIDSCILERFVPRNMNKEERRDRLIIMKTHTDLNIQSVMQQCWSDQPHINPILLTTLSADARFRLDGVRLCSLMFPKLCWRVTRTVPESHNHRTVSRSASTVFTTWSTHYVEASRDIHDMVFSQLRTESAPAYQLLSIVSPNVPTSIESQLVNADCIIRQASICLKAVEVLAKKQYGPRTMSYGSFSYEFALCHYLRLGTSRNLTAFNEYVNAAALMGYYTDLHLSLVAKALPPRDPLKSLRPLFLVVGAIIGKKTAMRSLKHDFPKLYQATLSSLSSRRDLERLRKFSSTSELSNWLRDLAHCSISNPQSFSLRECFETHNTQRAREILAADGFDASFIDEGLGIFHYLTYLEDNEAAALAGLCLERGGNLSHQAPHGSRTCLKTTPTPPSQTALAWAWAYGMEKYFDKLLQLHIQQDIPVKDYHILLWCSSEVFIHKSIQKLLRLFNTKPHLVDQDSGWVPLQATMEGRLQPTALKDYLLVCAGTCLSDRITGSVLDHHLISRIEHHGLAFTEARLQTLQTFIDAGVHVARYLGICLFSDDAASCGLLCAVLKKQVPSKGAYWSTLLHASIHGHSVHDTQSNRTEGAPRCFDAILSHFPELAADSATNPPCFTTPLCTAATVKNPFFARRLLELEADIDTELQNNSALALALAHGNLEIAELIHDRMTDDQRRRTFDGHPVTGFTMAGRLMGVWVRRREPALKDALVWLRKVDGARPVSNEKEKAMCWTVILTARPSPLREHLSRDTEILRLLFTWFPETLTSYTSNGFMPIHWAAHHGLVGVMKVLVSLGADVNAEVPTVEGALHPGRTALNIAIMLKFRLEKNVPVEIAEGGASEVNLWRQRCRDTLDFLNDLNAKSGSCSTEVEQYVAIHDQTAHISSGRVTFRIPESSEDIGNEGPEPIEQVAWPATLKPDRTSLSPEKTLYTKTWMKVFCGDLQRFMLVKRQLVFDYLHGDFLQPRAGQVSHPPKAYSSWLAQMAAARKDVWTRTNLPSDIGFTIPSTSMSLGEFKEWYMHGWLPRGSDRTIERLPRYRFIFSVGRPLRSSSRHDRGMANFLKALQENSLDDDDLEGPDAILIDDNLVQTIPVEILVSRLQDMKKRPGSGLVFLQVPVTGDSEEMEDNEKLVREMGWGNANRVVEDHR